MTEAQILLGLHLKELYGPMCGQLKFEYVFDPERKFAFDVYSPYMNIGFECDGGQFTGGHMRGKAIEQQYEKDRLAQIKGFKVFRFTNREILCGEAKQWLKDNHK